MPTAFSCATALAGRCNGISTAFSDAADAFDHGHLDPATFQAVAELSALDLHSQLETFLEEIFLSCLMGESGVETDRLIEPVTRSSAMDLLRHGSSRSNEYLTWLPLDRTIERAHSVFRWGQPFSRLEYRPAISGTITELVTVRNAVAHPSQAAAKKFRLLAERKGYTNARRPADYLLAVREGASELSHLVAVVRAVARGLAEPAQAEVSAVLGPERQFHTSEKSVPPGAYDCTVCGLTQGLLAGGVLDPCGGCPAPPAVCPDCGQAAPCLTCSKPRSRPSTYTRFVG
ncbi:MAG: hypothetical protein GY788_28370 [bacterium]|nr:hypothetical protein [bacterium]